MREEAIFEWRMTPDETSAFKLAILYEKEFRRIFSGSGIDINAFRRNVIPKRGDPRKSYLFRHCWKLRRETRGLLQPEQYRQYIIANFQILKLNNGCIEPNTICGDKAWIRWKVFERWMRDKESDQAASTPSPSVSSTSPKIIKEIDRTKKFLYERCEGHPTQEKIQKFLDDGIFKFWIMTEKVSKYYVVMSAFVQSSCDVNELSESCSFDPVLFRQKITQEVRDYFDYEHQHERS